MNNLSSYCGLVDARISASDKDLPVTNVFPVAKDDIFVGLILIDFALNNAKFYFCRRRTIHHSKPRSAKIT